MSATTLEPQQKFYRCPGCWEGFRTDECNIVPSGCPDLSHVECPKCGVFFPEPVPSDYPPVEPRTIKTIPIVWLNGRRWEVDLSAPSANRRTVSRANLASSSQESLIICGRPPICQLVCASHGGPRLPSLPSHKRRPLAFHFPHNSVNPGILMPYKWHSYPTSTERKSPMALQVTVKDGNLIVAIPLQTPNPSKSGKTLVVATTHGNAKTAFELPSHPGKQLTIGVNAYIPK